MSIQEIIRLSNLPIKVAAFTKLNAHLSEAISGTLLLARCALVANFTLTLSRTDAIAIDALVHANWLAELFAI